MYHKYPQMGWCWSCSLKQGEWCIRCNVKIAYHKRQLSHWTPEGTARVEEEDYEC